ncbi:hypothetical protein A0H81_12041 [Grifola frondosa]|uniref:Uncharacterized protein n=1 Tax=Grifola frondosa TaxID=5627 RepID=A0A1C7LTZ8_GRIFR|nr:hypothetical protein A0H81_12041 [Grifola frondosa]
MISFTAAKTLKHHTKSINALAVSPDGAVLLSGADDAVVVVWNLRTGEKLQEIHCTFNGPISAIAWLGTSVTNNTFIFGCADGSLHLYQRSDCAAAFVFKSSSTAHEGIVEDIVYDPHHNRIASVGGGASAVWKVTGTGSLTDLVKSDPRGVYIAKSVRFCDKGASIVVFYLESHEVVCHSIEPWALKWSKEVPTRIGHATLSPDETSLIISNLYDGLDIYCFPSLERVRSLPHPILQNYPMQVATTGPGDRWVLCGGDDGFARLYDAQGGHLLATLIHGDPGLLVQAVTGFTDEKCCLIVTGGSSMSSICAKGMKVSPPNDIKVWEHKPSSISSRRSIPEKPDSNLHLWQILLAVILTAFVVTAMNALILSDTAVPRIERLLNWSSPSPQEQALVELMRRLEEERSQDLYDF